MLVGSRCRGFGDGTFDHMGDAVLVLLAMHMRGMRGNIHIQ